MTLSYLEQTANANANILGQATVTINPPAAGQYWLPSIIRVATGVQQPSYAAVYVGPVNATTPNYFIDDTYTAQNDTSSIISGSLVNPGNGITVQFSGMQFGDTAYVTLYGVSSDIPPTTGVTPSFPGAHFSGRLSIPPNQNAPGSPWTPPLVGGSKNFPLSTFTKGLQIIIQPGGGAGIQQLTVTGQTSGIIYLNVNPNNLSQYASVLWNWKVPVSGLVDSVVTIAVNGGVTVNTKVYVAILTDEIDTATVQSDYIGAVPAQLPVQAMGLYAGAPWVYPNQSPTLIDTGTLAANGTFIILPAVANLQYFLHQVRLDLVASTTGNFHLQDTNGNDFGSYTMAVVGAPTAVEIPPYPSLEFHGCPLPIGVGLQIKNTSSGANRWLGHVLYSK